MKIETKYSIGDIVKIRCLVEEFVPVTSAHIVEGTGVIDAVNVTRNGINYTVYSDVPDRSYTEIVELIEKADPAKISADHFLHLEHYCLGGGPVVVSKKTGEEFDWFAYGPEGEISLNKKAKSNGLVVSHKELEKDYKYKVDFEKEENEKILLEGGVAWEVKNHILNENYIVVSDNINRYCDIYDCDKIKKIKIKAI